MKLDLNFSAITLLKDWWQQVKSNFTTVQTEYNSHQTSTTLDHPDKSVTTAKIADKGVTTSKIADYAVTVTQLAQGCVNNNRIANSAVDTRTIKDSSITKSKLDTQVQNQLTKMQTHMDNPSQEIADGAVTIDKLDGDLKGHIGDVYGYAEKSISVQVLSPFELTFTCKSLDGMYGGTWECNEVSDIYACTSINGVWLKEDPISAVRSISVYDAYLEEDNWEIGVIVNIDENDVDNIPYGAVTRTYSEKIFENTTFKRYPYIKEITSNTVCIIFGRVGFQSVGAVVGGSPSRLLINKKATVTETVTDYDRYETLDTLDTQEKSNIIAAINENVKNISDEATSRKSEDATLQSNITAESNERKTADTELKSSIDAMLTEKSVDGVYNQYNKDGKTYDGTGLTAIPAEVFTGGYSVYSGGYYYANGGYEANAWWWSIVVKCKPNTTYTNNSTQKKDNVWTSYDANGKRISGDNPSSGVYTTAENAAYLTFNTNKAEISTIAIVEGDTVPDVINPYTENPTVKKVIKSDYYDTDYLNKLYDNKMYEGKNVLVLGDSNSALSGTELTSLQGDWKHWFSEYAKPKSVTCVAVGGATLCDKENTVYDGNPVYNAADQSGNCFGNQVQKIINNAYEEPDAIIVLYGMNDQVQDLTDDVIETAFMTSSTGVGTVALADVDRTTYAGAFRYVNETLRNLYPNAVIVACTPLQQSAGARVYYKVRKTADSIIKLARRMSLPLWDTGGESGIYATYDEYGTEVQYDLGDGLHTNGYGARKLGRYMAQKFIQMFGF